MPRYNTFTTGGAVIHRLTVPGSACKFTIWTDPQGGLVDVGRYNLAGHELDATPAQWRDLAKRAKFLHDTAHMMQARAVA